MQLGRAHKYPPLVVEELPDWQRRFAEIKKRLGRPLCPREWVRFTLEDEPEYRVLQRYITQVEKEEDN